VTKHVGDHVIVEADGGSRGNPGPAGYGALVKDAAGRILVERKAALGVTTNNVAEYSGLIAGLQAAHELGASIVDVRMDSKLVVEQMSGRWKIKNEVLRPLAHKAGELASRFDRVEYQWIPRASNSDADRLANAAMDEQASGDSMSGVVQPGTVQSGAVQSARTQAADVNVAGGAPIPEPLLPWMAAQGAPTKFLLVRHGQTALSIDRRYSGRGDVPLTEYGMRQAAKVARRLAGMEELRNAGASIPIMSSPLFRAQQTAQSISDALGEPLETHPGLIEADFGAWEGLTFQEAADRDPEFHARWLRDPSLSIPDGESFEAVRQRVRIVRDEFVNRFPGQTVVIISHVTPIKSLIQMALDAGPSLFSRLRLDLASLSIVEFYPDGNSSVRLMNDTSHLG
jgi:probable phosphoglycerate mutase